jgi:hypothetical protein
MDIVKVDWWDATGGAPHLAPMEALVDIEPVPMTSVGFLVRYDDVCVNVCGTHSEGDHGMDVVVIPTSMVIEVKSLLNGNWVKLLKSGKSPSTGDSQIREPLDLDDKRLRATPVNGVVNEGLSECSCRREAY